MKADDLIWFIAGAGLPSFLVSWLATAAMHRLAPRVGLIDRPGARKVHTIPTPLGGGLGIWCGMMVTFAIGTAALMVVMRLDAAAQERFVPAFAVRHLAGLWDRIGELWILLACGTILSLLGLLDDRFGLDWRLRLGIQLAVALFCVVQQGWQLTAFISLPGISWLCSVALSTLWIVALINSFNMLDNMDGLSSGVAALAAGFLAAMLLLNPDPVTQRPQLFVAGFLIVLLGSILGFWLHNRPPARIFMGDAGSYLIGFSIAIATLLATYTSYQGTTPWAVLAPLCVMAVPLYDMVTVLYIRWREGRSLFQGDKSHFSHRLVVLGFTKRSAVSTILLLTGTCGLGALLLHRVDWTGAVLIVLMIGCVLWLIALLESTARRKLDQNGS
jgi:UDP-GlcNAc:undecaprenyl-phosphate GlcNAc-1-phosphate transferase